MYQLVKGVYWIKNIIIVLKTDDCMPAFYLRQEKTDELQILLSYSKLFLIDSLVKILSVDMDKIKMNKACLEIELSSFPSKAKFFNIYVPELQGFLFCLVFPGSCWTLQTAMI